jgi:hypothetical protein
MGSLFWLNLSGQTEPEMQQGTISYITSQSVYVKFESTQYIKPGDTLFLKKEGKLTPVLEVKNLSSISCVCSPISTLVLNVSDVILSKQQEIPIPAVAISEIAQDSLPASVTLIDTLPKEKPGQKELKQDINGRLSVASYSNFSNSPADNSQRMRYTFSLRANNINDSKLSAETYISFVNSNKNWDEVKANVFNGLKIYNLSVKYDFNESTSLLLGRKINPKLSSVGAIDGLQFETKFNTISVGAFAGSRPDYEDYSMNPNLFQYGIYAGHELKAKNGLMQNTLGFIEQDNHSQTDRRFLYFQHINSIVKNIYFFGSAEMGLYKKVNDKKENIFNLTNLYLSLRYRVIRQLSLGLSYSARQNIIYYETYKDFLERLLETETLQGWRFQVNYRPVKFLSLGVNAGYRFRKEDPKPSKNLYAYLTYSRLPGINAAITLSATLLETAYLKGNIYSLGMTKDLISGKLNGGLKYRYVDYLYLNTEFDQIQNLGEINLSWRMLKKLSLSVYYEGTFEKEHTFSRIYANLSLRF